MIYPKVNIIVLNWNGEKVLSNCIKSILQSNYSNFVVTVIDNGSTDLSLDIIASFHQNIESIKIDRNLGYAKAYNKAFEFTGYSKDSFFMLLNNDTIVSKNIINEFLNEQNMFGTKQYIFAGKIYYLNNHVYC